MRSSASAHPPHPLPSTPSRARGRRLAPGGLAHVALATNAARAVLPLRVLAWVLPPWNLSIAPRAVRPPRWAFVWCSNPRAPSHSRGPLLIYSSRPPARTSTQTQAPAKKSSCTVELEKCLKENKGDHSKVRRRGGGEGSEREQGEAGFRTEALRAKSQWGRSKGCQFSLSAYRLRPRPLSDRRWLPLFGQPALRCIGRKGCCFAMLRHRGGMSDWPFVCDLQLSSRKSLPLLPCLLASVSRAHSRSFYPSDVPSCSARRSSRRSATRAGVAKAASDRSRGLPPCRRLVMVRKDASIEAVRAALAGASAALLKDASLSEAMIKAQDDARRKEAAKAGDMASARSNAASSASSAPAAVSPRDAVLALKAEIIKAAVLFAPSSSTPSEEVARGFLASLCRVSAAAQLVLRGAGGLNAGATLREAAGKEASRLAALSAAALRALSDSLGSEAGPEVTATQATGGVGQSASTRAVAAAATAADEAAGKSWDDVSVMVSSLIKPLKVLDEAHRDLSETIREGEEAAAVGELAASADEDDDLGLAGDVLDESEMAVAKQVQQLVVKVGKLVRCAAASLVSSRRGDGIDDEQLALWKKYAPLCVRAARLGDAVAGESLAPQDPTRLKTAAEQLKEVTTEAAALATGLGQEHIEAVAAVETAVGVVLESVRE